MWLVDETKRNLPKELDFLHEAENAKKVSQQLRHLRFLKVVYSYFQERKGWFQIPRIYDELTTKRVLTMEYCPGAQIDDAQYMKDNKIDTHDVRFFKNFKVPMIFLSFFSETRPKNDQTSVYFDQVFSYRFTLERNQQHRNVEVLIKNFRYAEKSLE